MATGNRNRPASGSYRPSDLGCRVGGAGSGRPRDGVPPDVCGRNSSVRDRTATHPAPVGALDRRVRCTRSGVRAFGRSGVARRRRSTGEARAGVARRRAAEAPAWRRPVSGRWAACGPPGRAGAGSGPGGASLPVYSPMASTSRRRRVGSSRARTARNRSGWAWFGGDGDLWSSSFPTFTGSVSHCRQRTGTVMGLIGPTRGAAHHRRTRHPLAGARIEPVQKHERQVGLAARSWRPPAKPRHRPVRAGGMNG